MNKPFHVTFV